MRTKDRELGFLVCQGTKMMRMGLGGGIHCAAGSRPALQRQIGRGGGFEKASSDLWCGVSCSKTTRHVVSSMGIYCPLCGKQHA